MAGGGQELQTGWIYGGSVAQFIGFGPADVLRRITNGETEIWVGPLVRGITNPVILNTTIGTIRFYWGTSTQPVDSLLNGLTIDLGAGPVLVPMSAYKNIIYAVLEGVNFGNQTTPPTLSWELDKYSSALSLSAHSLSQDSVLPEVLYELIVNSLFGAGVAAADVATASFSDAAEIVIAEAFGVSPVLDSLQSSREVLSKLLFYIDGFLFLRAGQITLGLIRKPSGGYTYPTIDESILIEEPQPAHLGYDGSWSITSVTFTDRDNNWDTDSEPYTDPANANAFGQTVWKEQNAPYVTQRSIAKLMAKRIGTKGGMPVMSWELVIKPIFWLVGETPSGTTLPVPGDLFKLSYARFGIVNRVCRVMEVEWMDPHSRQMKITALEESTRDTTNDYIPPADTFGVPFIVDESGNSTFDLISAQPRVAAIPSGLKEGNPDGWVLAVNRTSGLVTRVDEYMLLQAGYQKLNSLPAFPAYGQLIWWGLSATGTQLLRIQLANTWDADLASLYSTASEAFYAVTGQRQVQRNGQNKNQHQIAATWAAKVVGGYYNPMAGLVIDLEVSPGSFSGTADRYESITLQGIYPTEAIYLGPTRNFLIEKGTFYAFERLQQNYALDHFVRSFKTPIHNIQTNQSLGDVTAVTFDRDDPTMNPDGTFGLDWGLRVPTVAEYYDVNGGAKVTTGYSINQTVFSDIDAALGALLDGTATAAQRTITAPVDLVLGEMLTTGNEKVYSDNL